MKNKSRASAVTNHILAYLMSASISQALYTSLFNKDVLSTNVFFITFIMLVLVSVVLNNKITLILSGCLLALGTFLTSFSYISHYGIVGSKQRITHVFFEIKWFIIYGEFLTDGLQNIVTYVMVFSTTLLVYIFTVKLFSIYIVAFGGISIFCVQEFMGIFICKNSLYIFMFSLLIYFIFDTLRIRSKRISYSYGNKLKYLLSILPFCLLIMAVSFILPTKEKPLEWEWLDNKLYVIDQKVNGSPLQVFDTFSLSRTGLSENEKNLGGDLKQDDTHVMDVKSSMKNLYLKAYTKFIYSGKGWFDINEDVSYGYLGKSIKYSDDISTDAMELLNGYLTMSNKRSKSAPDYSKAASVKITYVDMNTKFIFTPPKAYQITFDKELPLCVDSEDNLTQESLNTSGLEYNISYLQLNTSSYILSQYIRKSFKGLYDYCLDKNIPNEFDNSLISPNSLDQHFPNKFLKREQLEELNNHAAEVYDKYLQLPDTLPSRVVDLTNDLVKNEKNNFDRAKAIETYLSNNFTYTLTPGKVPQKIDDFVDYFLFDKKEGYCTYYATAMTVMLRSIGIPARYVGGYVLPPVGSNGIYKVTNKEAHAWVEAYFEGFGWVSFEPTSSSFSLDASVTPATPSVADTSVADDTAANSSTAVDSEPVTDENQSIFDGMSSANTGKKIISVIIILLTLSAIGILLFNLLRHQLLMRRINEQIPKQAILMIYQYYLTLLALLGLKPIPGETPSQFGLRVDAYISSEAIFATSANDKQNPVPTFTYVTDIFIQARYSGQGLQNAQKDEMLAFYEILLENIRQQMGTAKYLLYRYILGIVK